MSRGPRNWGALLTVIALAAVIAVAYALLAWWLIQQPPATDSPATPSTVEVNR
jgi:hypothetical protein